jgi:DNA polymerase III delta prime subunit
MDNINLNQILNRENISIEIKRLLIQFEYTKYDKSIKNGIYIYGNPGCGKTHFITNLLNELNYDIIKFDAGDIRNTSVIEDITKHNMSSTNVLSMFTKDTKKKVILMDEIDGMNNGDKGGINSLIKLIRPKKTSKQKKENFSYNPIICISNYKIDKKIKELIKVCNTFELITPDNIQIKSIINKCMPSLTKNECTAIINYSQGDLKKMSNIIKIYTNDAKFCNNDNLGIIFEKKNYNDDTKKTTKLLFNKKFDLSEHSCIINETDRTSIGLLWHENIIDSIDYLKSNDKINFYIKQLNNICFSDYIDRITFQNQIWQFNEMSSLIKTFYNHKLYHDFDVKQKIQNDIRFTKVLTKYSTEFNNIQFIQKLCQKLTLDKSDLIGFFNELKTSYTESDILLLNDKYEIGKLEINRIFRYIEKYTEENAIGTSDKIIEDDESDLEY